MSGGLAFLISTAEAHPPADAAVRALQNGAGLPAEWPLLGILLLFGVWYAIGFHRVWKASGPGRASVARRGLLYACGWLVIAASLLSPLHALGARSFTAHMMEHELLMLAAAPLIAFSHPLGMFVWAFPRGVRHGLADLGHSAGFSLNWSRLSSPLGATLLQAAMLWLWHAPAFFDRALVSEGWHSAQHLSLVISATLFWWSMNTASRNGHHGVAGLFLFVTSVHSSLLGALMAFAMSPWYAQYTALGLTGMFGLTPLEDQQVAGLIMWVPGGAIHALAALIYLSRWLPASGAQASRGTEAAGVSVPVRTSR